MKSIAEHIQEVKGKGELSPKQLKILEGQLTKITQEGKSIYQACGVSKESLEFIYAHAYHLYNAAKYKEAKDFFYVLDFLDDNDIRFSFGIAACFDMEKKYPEALANYILSLHKDPNNPLICWHIAECYRQLGYKTLALITLERCILKSQDPAFEQLKTRAEREFVSLEQELNEEAAKEKAKVDAGKPQPQK